MLDYKYKSCYFFVLLIFSRGHWFGKIKIFRSIYTDEAWFLWHICMFPVKRLHLSSSRCKFQTKFVILIYMVAGKLKNVELNQWEKLYGGREIEKCRAESRIRCCVYENNIFSAYQGCRQSEFYEMNFDKEKDFVTVTSQIQFL